MIEIKDITDNLLIQCPKCKTGQLLTSWGKRKCHYENCDGEIELEYNLQNVEKLLEIAAKELRDYRKPKKVFKPSCQLYTFPNGDTIATYHLTECS